MPSHQRHNFGCWYCYICVLILLYMCPHTAIYVSSYCYICVLILLYMCPHTAIYVSSYCYICVLVPGFCTRYCETSWLVDVLKRNCNFVYLFLAFWHGTHTMCPILLFIYYIYTIYVSSYHHICVLVTIPSSLTRNSHNPRTPCFSLLFLSLFFLFFFLQLPTKCWHPFWIG